MNIFKNITKVFLIVIFCLSFASCKDENILTNIEEIDNEYKFINKDVFKFDKDSIYTFVELFYNKTLEDSVYTIAINKNDDYIIRARGWGVKEGRIGNWYYEKVYNNQRVVIDSIINSIILCNHSSMNTIKKFKNNVLDKSRGYFYEINMKKNIYVNDTLDIKVNFEYDTIAFDKIGRELYLFNPPSLDNYCDASKFVIDSFPIINRSTKMKFLVENKGKRKLLGYYFLRKKNRDSSSKALQIFTEISFEVE